MNFLKKIFQRKTAEERGKEKTETVKSKVIPTKELQEIQKGTVLGVIEYPHVTEKSSASAGMNKYVFSVSRTANKLEISRAVESHYGVRAESVNVLNSPGKERVRGKQRGWRPGFKKAVVTLKEGQNIELT